MKVNFFHKIQMGCEVRLYTERKEGLFYGAFKIF